jgi:hypothetical protein
MFATNPHSDLRGPSLISKMEKARKISIILFVLGIILCLTSATLLFFGLIPSSTSIVIGIIGIGLIASSNFRLLK